MHPEPIARETGTDRDSGWSHGRTPANSAKVCGGTACQKLSAEMRPVGRYLHPPSGFDKRIQPWGLSPRCLVGPPRSAAGPRPRRSVYTNQPL